MYMNQCEIAIAVSRIQKPASLVKGANFLHEFCQLINGISDGWAYWSYGTKCSQDLQEIVNEGQWPVNQTAWKAKKVKPAINKVLDFLQTCKQTKDTPVVIEFVERWNNA